MSLEEAKEEAEAVLDSAEMILETVPENSQTRNLKTKIRELEQELQDPDSARSLKKKINEVRELMEEVKDQPAEDDFMEPGPQEPGGMGGPPPGGDDHPPI